MNGFQNYPQPYNPMYGSIMQQPMMAQPNTQPNIPQNVQQMTLPGRVVDDFNNISVYEVSMNDTPSVFIKNDLSEIQLRKWSPEGKIIPMVYKAVLNNAPLEPEINPMDALAQQLKDIEDKLDRIIKPTSAKKVAADGSN